MWLQVALEFGQQWTFTMTGKLQPSPVQEANSYTVLLLPYCILTNNLRRGEHALLFLLPPSSNAQVLYIRENGSTKQRK